MKKFYTVDAISESGSTVYWNPTKARFEYGDSPDNLYCKYTDALREYRRAMDEAAGCNMLSVKLKERVEDEQTHYHILKERRLTKDEQYKKAIWDEMDSIRANVSHLSYRVGDITALSKLSRETRGEIERINRKLYSLSQLMWNLQNKVLEELDKNVQDTEN